MQRLTVGWAIIVLALSIGVGREERLSAQDWQPKWDGPGSVRNGGPTYWEFSSDGKRLAMAILYDKERIAPGRPIFLGLSFQTTRPNEPVSCVQVTYQGMDNSGVSLELSERDLLPEARAMFRDKILREPDYHVSAAIAAIVEDQIIRPDTRATAPRVTALRLPTPPTSLRVRIPPVYDFPLTISARQTDLLLQSALRAWQ